MTKKPNFFIVGAEKAGTTSLYNYMSQHPDIYMCPIKEPNFFCTDLSFDEITKIDIKKYLDKEKLEAKHIAHVKNVDQYNKLYREVGSEKMIGESSVSYLFSNVAAKNIFEYNPDSKIIIILRNPVDRAFSEYKMDLGIGRVKTSFLQASGINSKYIDKSMYYEQVKRYYKAFPSKNIKIILFDSFKNNSHTILKELFDFLEVDNEVNIVDALSNESIAAKSQYLNYALNKSGIKSIIRKVLPHTLKEEFKKRYYTRSNIRMTMKDFNFLQKIFKEDIEKLSSLINKDLSSWVSNNTQIIDG